MDFSKTLFIAGSLALVAGGYGSAAILPAAEALKARGQRVITILGGRSRERVLLAEELDAATVVAGCATPAKPNPNPETKFPDASPPADVMTRTSSAAPTRPSR